MKLKDLFNHPALQQEPALRGIPEARAARITHLGLQALAAEMQQLDTGRIQIPGFGTFVIRQVQRQHDDGSTTTEKRIIFRPHSPADTPVSGNPTGPAPLSETGPGTQVAP